MLVLLFIYSHYTSYSDAADDHSDYDGDGDGDEVMCSMLNREDPSQLEMSFDLGHYQPSLRPRYVTPPVGTTDATASSSSSVLPSPIYQSIFLDKGSCESSWTWKRIDPAKVLLVKWWRQFSHEVSHFLRVVPFVRLIQGTVMITYEGGHRQIALASYRHSIYLLLILSIYLY